MNFVITDNMESNEYVANGRLLQGGVMLFNVVLDDINKETRGETPNCTWST